MTIPTYKTWTMQSLLKPNTAKDNDTRLQWGNLHGCAASLSITEFAKQQNKPLLIVTPDIHTSNKLVRELKFFAGTSPNLEILNYPDLETLAYDHFSPHEDIISERLYTLFRITLMNKGIIVAAVSSLLYKLAPKEYLQAHTFILQIGDKLNPQGLSKRLMESGYSNVEQVLQHGEYSIRGAMIDIFPMGSKTPYRIELFDNDVETIRSFDPDTQRSIEKTDSIRLLPAREYPLTDDSITHFRNHWREQFSGNPSDCPIYNSISNGEHANGIEYYLPLFFDKLCHFFDYLTNDSIIFHLSDTQQQLNDFYDSIKHRYDQLAHDTSRPILTPEQIFLTPQQFLTLCKPHTQIILQQQSIAEKQANFNFNNKQLPDLIVNHKAKNPVANLEAFINKHSGRYLFCAESTGRREALLELLKPISIYPHQFDGWQSFLGDNHKIGICIAPLDTGLYMSDPDITVICESDLFGEQVMQRRLRKQQGHDPELMIRNLTELKIGDPVVHIDYGVGRYQGLKLIKTSDHEAEYVTIEYASDDKIYVPIQSLHLISRYTGVDKDHAPLQRLGTSHWKKIRKKSLEKIRDTAAELLDLYSKRAATPGHAYPKTDKDFCQFRQAFPFEETPDQASSIDAVINDMLQPHSMDRLVCGDVGFGKTEVAMQAAFHAANTGKQVAILVPTTLLANQHTQNFKDRMADWPIRIDELSRMQSAKQQNETIKALEQGNVDIVIGTHKLLQPSIKFKDLGLLIIDEEHRFGVGQKEKIKQLRAHVDILTLTATPIPRTLNMALAGTRDLSIIATPPAKRLSIKTFLYNYNKEIIAEAVNREIMRGGQVYFIHNDVATLPAMAEKLQQIVPNLRVAIAHGQMPERQLERVMTDFYHQKYQVLICTTIIESGIDIPSANTIIINHADRFGLAQIHQLRGRVGRSHRQAYAYLLVTDKKCISKDAEKRLQAISELDALGAGFNLANHDLEIRGAGELLGEEQSGHIEAIGFSLFMELLEEAVTALKSGKEPLLDMQQRTGTEIDLHLSALIPDILVPDVNMRLTLYKRLSHCNTQNEIHELRVEMIDRFGKLPEATLNLIKISELKLTASKLGIQKIDMGTQSGSIDFIEKPPIDPMCIINLIQQHPKEYQLVSNQRLKFNYPESTDRFMFLSQLFSKFKQ